MLQKIKCRVKSLFNMLSKNIPNHTLRVIGFDGCPDQKNTHVHYQICGKSVVSQQPLGSLVSELVQINGFSPSDSNQILTLLLAENRTPSFKILSVIFSEQGDEFEIANLKESCLMNRTAAALFETPEVLSEFSSEDVIRIQKSFMETLRQFEKRSVMPNQSTPLRGNLHVIKY